MLLLKTKKVIYLKWNTPFNYTIIIQHLNSLIVPQHPMKDVTNNKIPIDTNNHPKIGTECIPNIAIDVFPCEIRSPPNPPQEIDSNCVK